MPSSTSTQRRLHAGHFAFMRALVQGLDTRASWDRYLRIEGEHTDIRLVKKTIQWIRDEFAAAAQRHHRHGLAKLIVLDLSKVPDEQRQLPTLEEFAYARGLEDFSEAEQLDAYEAHYGESFAGQSRRARLIQKQLDGLAWLENLVAQPPRAGDGVGAWLAPALAEKLKAHDILSLRQLVDRVNARGRGWWRGIQGIGSIKGERIVDWLIQHQVSIGFPIRPTLGVKPTALTIEQKHEVVAPATDIRPIEKFVIPLELDGSQGRYRHDPALCLIYARNDYEAVLAWLRSKRPLSDERRQKRQEKRLLQSVGQAGEGAAPLSTLPASLAWMLDLSHTQRAYRKEAERFLLWAILERKKPLSSMTVEDCIAYREFLENPTPASVWCGPRNQQRWSPTWKPFEGPLSAKARGQAQTILQNLYQYLNEQNYLIGNPWKGVSKPIGSMQTIDVGRAFTFKQWEFIESQLQQLPETSVNRRLSFALHLLYATGMRLFEVVVRQCQHLRWVEYVDGDEVIAGWWLKVHGKRDKVREVPVDDAVIEELRRYLVSRGLSPDPRDAGNLNAYLLGWPTDIDTRAPLVAKRFAEANAQRQRIGLAELDVRLIGISESTLYEQLKLFFANCSAQLLSTDPLAAERFVKASTHWLRHTHASHMIANELPVQIAQKNLDHASLDTTTLYVTTEEKERMKAIQKALRKTR